MRVLSAALSLIASAIIVQWVWSVEWDMGSVTILDVVRLIFSRDFVEVATLLIVFPVLQFALGWVARGEWANSKLASVACVGLFSWFWLFHALHLFVELTHIRLRLGGDTEVWHFGTTEKECLIHVTAMVLLPLVAGLLWNKGDMSTPSQEPTT